VQHMECHREGWCKVADKTPGTLLPKMKIDVISSGIHFLNVATV